MFPMQAFINLLIKTYGTKTSLIKSVLYQYLYKTINHSFVSIYLFGIAANIKFAHI